MEWFGSYFSPYRERGTQTPLWQRELHPLRAIDLAEQVLDPMLSYILGQNTTLRQSGRHRRTSVTASNSTVLFDYSDHVYRHGIGIEGVPLGYVPYHKKGEESVVIKDPNVDQYISLNIRQLLTPDQLFYFAEEEWRIVNALGKAISTSQYLSNQVQLVQGVGSELLTVAGANSDHDISIVAPGIDLARLNEETVFVNTLKQVSAQSNAPINFIFCYEWEAETDRFEVHTVTY